MSEYWQTKTSVGIGTLMEYSKECERIDIADGMFTTNSRLYPTGNIVECPIVQDKRMQFEWVIYYKVAPKDLKYLDKKTGKVEVQMTEQEGREMDLDVQEEVMV